MRLAKCPHEGCGDKRVMTEGLPPQRNKWRVKCPKCGAAWPRKPTKEAAIIAANVGCWCPIGEYDFEKVVCGEEVDEHHWPTAIDPHPTVLVRGEDGVIYALRYRWWLKDWVDHDDIIADEDDNWITEFMEVSNG